MNNLRLKYFVIVILATLNCCVDEQFDEVSAYHELSPFGILELNSVFDVNLVQDTTFGVEVVGHEKIIGNISLKVVDGILTISNESRGKWLRPEYNKVKLYVHAIDLYEVRPNATCAIRTVNPIVNEEFRLIMGHRPKLSEIDLELDCGAFLYWNNHQCGGKVILRGKAEEVIAHTYGLMSFDASQLNTDYAWIENNSKNDCQVSVNNKFEYSIRGVGNIYLSGDPPEVILHERTSSGTLIKVD
jgi:hypothetical protein